MNLGEAHAGILACFKKLDAKGTGTIEMSRLLKIVEAVSTRRWSREELAQVVENAGLLQDGNGKCVDYTSFVRWMFSTPPSKTLRFFYGSNGYAAGEAFDTADTSYEVATAMGTPIYVHRASGVSVMQEAWDLRTGGAEGQVVFFQCANVPEFERLAAETILSEEVWESVQGSPEEGVILVAPEPSATRLSAEEGYEGLWVPVILDPGVAIREADAEGPLEQWRLVLPASQAAERAGSATERRKRCVLCSMRAACGRDDNATLGAMNDLAFILEARGKTGEASELCAEALAIYKETRGETHPDTLTCMNNLAFLLDQEGKPTEAEALARQVFASREATLGEDHADTNTAVYNLAELLEARGNLDEAEKLFDREHEWCRKTYGPRHQCTRESWANLCRFRKVHKRSSAAIEGRLKRGKFTSAF